MSGLMKNLNHKCQTEGPRARSSGLPSHFRWPVTVVGHVCQFHVSEIFKKEFRHLFSQTFH